MVTARNVELAGYSLGGSATIWTEATIVVASLKEAGTTKSRRAEAKASLSLSLRRFRCTCVSAYLKTYRRLVAIT